MPQSWRSAGVLTLLVLLGVISSAGNALVLVTVAVAVAMFTLAALRPKLMLWVVILTILLLPSYVRVGVPGLPIMIPFSLVVGIALAAVLAIEWPLRRAGPLCGPDGRRLGMVFLVFAAVALASLLDPKTVLDSVKSWVKMLVAPTMLCLIILRLLEGTHDVDRMFKVMSIGCLFIVFYAIGEFATGRNFVAAAVLGERGVEVGEFGFYSFQGEDFARIGSIHRVSSLFISPIEFGGLLSMVYPYALLRLLHAGSPRTHIGWAVAAALMVFGVALSFSRGPMLAVILCTLLLAVFVKPLRRYVAYGCVLAALAIAITWPQFGDKLQERMLDKDNVTLRLKLWDIAAHMALDHPLVGVGLNNFAHYQIETIRRNQINTIDEPYAGRIPGAENLYLQLAAETGVIGLASFIGVFVLFFTLTVHLYRRYPPGAGRSLILATGVGTTACLVTGLTSNSYDSYPTMMMMGALFAALLILDRDAPIPGR